ncbi:FliM/FliN family flagellar motor switch protein [Aliiroseovarius marinus]|uniref:FliM/FliN family flagellar motor switch protein n=1 Tax=Aliiroseovarius marinus TaxID=2500159 RepID=UPI003D7D9887
MADQDMTSAIRRKAGAGRPPPEISPTTSGSALRMALSKSAEDVAALIAAPIGVDEDRMTLETLTEKVVEHSLLILVEGPGSAFGLVVLDPNVMAALVEVQTTGRVVPTPAVPRAPTRTDAIMCSDFVDKLLELFEVNAAQAQLPLADAVSGYRYALRLADMRAANMALENVPYRVLSAQLDLDGGAKEGNLLIVLPFDPPAPRHVAMDDSDGAASGQGDMAQIVEGTEARLHAVLNRVGMTVADVSGLEVGMMLPLAREKLGQVDLVDVSGQVVSQCRLGQQGGRRALRIGEAYDETMDPAASGSMTMAQPAQMSLPDEMGLPALEELPMAEGAVALEFDQALGDGEMAPLPGSDMPDLPPLDGGLDTGDLPDLGDLPDIGNLPDLPEPETA